jgi:dihydroflavonol-4-reductase
MSTILVTGASGLIGSNICSRLLDAGDRVRALVRPTSDAAPLAAIGVALVEGDLTSADDVHRAAEGSDAIINSAAVLGGAEQDGDEQRATNVDGAGHVYDAGRALGIRVVGLSTTTFYRHDTTLTEASPVADEWSLDPYTRSKGAAYVDAMRRVDDGADIVMVIPGGTYGPALSVRRAMHRTSFDRVLRGAIAGKIAEYVAYPVPWVLADDVAAAAVAAIAHGTAGEKYLAFGREDAQSTARFLNLACAITGIDHRVAEVVIDPVDPKALERYGPSLVALALRSFPEPWFDNRITRERLGYEPRSLRDGLALTVDWMRRERQIPDRPRRSS